MIKNPIPLLKGFYAQPRFGDFSEAPDDVLLYVPNLLRAVAVVFWCVAVLASIPYLIEHQQDSRLVLTRLLIVITSAVQTGLIVIYAHKYYRLCIMGQSLTGITGTLVAATYMDGFNVNPHFLMVLIYIFAVAFTIGRSGVVITTTWTVVNYLAIQATATWAGWPQPTQLPVAKVQHENGSVLFFLLLVLVPLLLGYATLIRNSLRRLKDLYTQQRQHDQHLLQTLTAERARIGRDLHDGPLQDNTRTKYKLEVCATLLAKGDVMGAQAALERGLTLLAEQHAQIRAVVDAVRPQELTALGLVAALHTLPAQLAPTLAVTMICADDIVCAAESEAAIYYIVREALANAQRHGQARHATVRLHRQGDQLILDIQDDGRGFDPQVRPPQAQAGGHHGLSSMVDRTVLLGGQLQIQSTPGHGTRIHAGLPLHPTALERVA
ncbi:MAG: sensor histidine kinase [Chloroflexota bacterium]|nr:sensor histidine kinase [Chloroflexota bacterium]